MSKQIEDTDLLIENHGSIFLLRPCSERGKQWVAKNIPEDAQTFGLAIVVEHRYIADIAKGATEDGLKVE
jgi:hypothetical protein